MSSPEKQTRPDVAEAKRRELEYVIPFERAADEYEPRMAVGADGSWIEFADGTRLLDLHGQYMCVGMGHGDPRLRQALHEAVDGLDFVCEVLTHERKGQAAKLLCEDTMEEPTWAGAAKFVSSGSEAVELALLTARLFKNRPAVVTTQAAYHGWTTGAAAATTLPYLRNVFHEVESGEVRTVSTAHQEFHAVPAPIGCTDETSIRAVVDETERSIRAIGVENVAGLITELYYGAGGFMVPDGYPQLIREMCDRLGILWIDDEVIAGAGRTGKWWAFQHFGVTPDLMCTAKGLTSSSVPGGAVVMSKRVAAYLRRGRWAAVSTFGGHPLACAAIAANIEIMLDEGVVEHAAEVGARFGEGLHELVARHPSAAGLSGKGLAWSIELCRDPVSGEKWVPADRWLTASVDAEPELMPGQLIAEVCEEHGVLLFNFLPNTVTIAPPLRISEGELQIGLDALEQAFTVLDGHVTEPSAGS
jgi:taurine--2-oxoglutarate transaminase